MTEHPIIFTAESIRATLDGRKTQTRRVIKLIGGLNESPCNIRWSQEKNCWQNYGAGGVWIDLKCPYGSVGDTLWVRETWDFRPMKGALAKNRIAIVGYKADDATKSVYVPQDCNPKIHKKWCSPIRMPKQFARIFLDITGIRVERVRDISEEDAKAEGVRPSIVGTTLDYLKYRASYQTLWNSLNAKRGYGWESNPRVWIIEFKKNEEKQ